MCEKIMFTLLTYINKYLERECISDDCGEYNIPNVPHNDYLLRKRVSMFTYNP